MYSLLECFIGIGHHILLKEVQNILMKNPDIVGDSQQGIHHRLPDCIIQQASVFTPDTQLLFHHKLFSGIVFLHLAEHNG